MYVSDKKALDDFIGDYKLNRKDGISVVSTMDLSQLKSVGYNAEDLFNHLSEHYRSFLHGSRTYFDSPIRPSKLSKEKSKVFGSNYATFLTHFGSIALLKAILSNRGSNLGYSMHLNDVPLKVKIKDINENTIGKEGYVYLVNNSEGFVNGLNFESNKKQKMIDSRNWIEHVKIGSEPVSYNAVVSVVKTDFTYPIFDVTNNKRIQ